MFLVQSKCMTTQMIKFGFDTEAVWNRISGRLSVFMDTNCWIEMADAKNPTACRVRDRLKTLVAAGRVFCPLSWGIIEELFKQSGPSLRRTASLMEELSLNAIFIIRKELYSWELSRSVRRFCGQPVDESQNGLFVLPAAFVGSMPCVTFAPGFTLSPAAVASAQAYMMRNLSKIGVLELANLMGARQLNETPPAYSVAAKNLMEQFKGNKKKIFLEEAGNCFSLYITPALQTYPPDVMWSWLGQFGSPDGEEAFFAKALAQLPALHNFIDIMVVADTQPTRKDEYNDFMDNEIMVAPLAYATVFVSKDRAVRDMLRNRTKILNRTKCQYCDSLDALESWMTLNAA